MAVAAETLEDRTPHNLEGHERYKSFDVLASVDLYDFDIRTYGYILPETRQRVYDEELSYIAEGINRPLDTDFVLHEVDGELAIFNDGKWQPYQASLLRGLKAAEQEAVADPRKGFLAEHAAKDYIIGQQFKELQPGEKIAWYSAFPEEAYQKYGQQFVDSLGFQSKRKLGFIYTAEKRVDGSVMLSTRSVDGNDEDGFVAAIEEASKHEASIEDARDAYDDAMQQKHGGTFFAGRRVGENGPEENAWSVIEQQEDLLTFYFSRIEELAAKKLPRDALEKDKKRLTYGVWAAIKERLDNSTNTIIPSGVHQARVYDELKLSAEVNQAFQTLSNRGEVMPGCGGAISGEAALMNESSESVFNSIFGGGSDKYGSLKFKCPKGHTNTRPHGVLIPNCKKCGISVKC